MYIKLSRDTLGRASRTPHWLNPHLNDFCLDEITGGKIEGIAKIKEESSVEPSTVNHMLAVVRAICAKQRESENG